MKKWKAYPKYKDSGVEWLGDVPEGWEVRRIKFACTCNDETLPETTDPDYEIEYVDISSVNLHEGIINTEILAFDKAPSRARRIVRNDDTIVSTVRTYLKAIATIRNAPENLIVSTGFAVLRPTDLVDGSFLSYYLQNEGFINAVVASSVGVSYPAINATELTCLCISFPLPLAEQKTIAAFLDKKTEQIDRLIAKKKALIERLNEKRTALITESVTGRNLAMILEEQGGAEHGEITYRDSGVEWLGQIPEGWEDFPMRRVAANVKTGATPSGVDDFYFSDDGLNWYTPGDFDRGIRLDQAKRKLSEEGRQEVRVFPASTVLMVGIGATIGKVAVISGSSAFNQQINGIIFELSVDPLFAAYFLTTLRDYIFKCGKYTTLPIINQDETKSLPFVSPPLAEQEAIAAFLDKKIKQIDELLAKVQSAIEKLQEYRTAVITAAVTGKIDVRGEA